MKSKKLKNAILIAVLSVLALVCVGYAAFSVSLSINGVATVDKSSWSIKFKSACTNSNDCFVASNTQNGVEPKTKIVTYPNLTDTTISDWVVSFSTPGDSISYTFNVVNDGTFNAKISTFELPTPVCTGFGTNAETDAKNVCDNTEYTLKDSNGNDIEVGRTLSAGQSDKMILSLTYKASIKSADLPENDVKISNLGFPIIYTQIN